MDTTTPHIPWAAKAQPLDYYFCFSIDFIRFMDCFRHQTFAPRIFVCPFGLSYFCDCRQTHQEEAATVIVGSAPSSPKMKTKWPNRLVQLIAGPWAVSMNTNLRFYRSGTGPAGRRADRVPSLGFPATHPPCQPAIPDEGR